MNGTFTSDGRFPEGLSSATCFEGKTFETVALQTARYPLGVTVLRFNHFLHSV